MNKRIAQKVVNNQYKKGSKIITVEFYTKSGVNKTERIRLSCQAVESVLKYDAFQVLGIVPKRYL